MKSFWTPEKEQFIRDNYESMTALQMAAHFETSRSVIKNRIMKMELKKSHNPGKYTPGTEPANKGKIMDPALKESIKHTFFKAGHKPHNTMYDGHERISKDGYIEVRVSEGNYQHKQRVIWEQHFGTIPEGYIIAFKDGVKTNIDPSNLKIITRAQHAQNTQQSDGYIASKLAACKGTGRGKYNKELAKELLKHPELIELKRNQLKLNRTLKQKK